MQQTRLIACSLAFVICGLGAAQGRQVSEIAEASYRGDTAAIERLLQEGADVNASRVDGSTAIHWAVYRDDLETAERLIDAGADVTLATREGVTPMHVASLHGNSGMIAALLRAGADARQRGPNQTTMLMLAARNGNPDALRLLIDAGAEVNATENLRGTTALMWAVEQRHPEAVEILLDTGADPAIQSSGAGLPRIYIARPVNVDAVEEAQELLQAAVDAGLTLEQFRDRQGQSNAELNLDAVVAFLTDQAEEGGVDLLTALSRVEVELASFGVDLDELRALLGRRADTGPEAAADDATPVAATNNVPPGAAANNVPPGAAANNAPPGAAANNAPPGAAANNAPPVAATNNVPPVAAANNVPPVVRTDLGEDDDDASVEAGLVGEGGGGLTPLVLAAREGDLDSARILLDHGADVNQLTYYGWSPVLAATNNRNYRLGRFLIESGADVNIANAGGMTPLYLATDNRNIEGGDYPVPRPDMDHLEYIRILLENGADPNARVGSNTENRTIFTQQWFFEPGATAFVRAGQSGDTALLRLLMEFGADPAIPTDFGDTALSAVAGIGWVDGVTFEWSPEETVEAVQFLLELGLDPNSINGDGRTPLMGGALKGRNEIVRLLVDAGARLETRDWGSRDTDRLGESKLAGHTWQAIDYADGLVRVGVQSAVTHPETAAYIRELMIERGFPVPPADRTVESICIVVICQQGPEGPLQ